ncbi:hypothetical protein MRX96_043584 [Rhipicephalus microplus]
MSCAAALRRGNVDEEGVHLSAPFCQRNSFFILELCCSAPRQLSDVRKPGTLVGPPDARELAEQLMCPQVVVVGEDFQKELGVFAFLLAHGRLAEAILLMTLSRQLLTAL